VTELHAASAPDAATTIAPAITADLATRDTLLESASTSDAPQNGHAVSVVRTWRAHDAQRARFMNEG
jgi:hypothetical protein